MCFVCIPIIILQIYGTYNKEISHSQETSLAMDHIENSLSLKSSSSTRNEETQPSDLLEENWFFGNLLDKKKSTKTMSRSYSDPSPSSMGNEKLSQTKKNSLVRAPSLPPSVGRSTGADEKEIVSGSKEKSSTRKPRMSLHRAPSLPPCIGREEDVESEYSLSRLIRQASLNSSDELPPKHNSKVTRQCRSAPRCCPKTKIVPENIGIEHSYENGNQSVKVQPKLRKSMSDVKVQFTATCYKFDNKYINPIEIPGFQEKPRVRYSESSYGEDMKTQIKYWARSVAANVR